MAETSVGVYLFSRLGELGIKSISGVPGDYELVLLDMIPEAGLTWHGNANELIAGYAADGYARVSGVAAFVTTYGPGELSAYCAMAGQYAEYVPVVHVVGYPSTVAMNGKMIMHHSLGDGNFGMYQKMVEHISVASTVLMDAKSAASEIDRVLNAMLYHSRPVYIGVPVDIGPQMISSGPLESSLQVILPKNNPEFEVKAVVEIIRRLQSSKQPVILVDGVDESEALIELLKIPYFATAMSKGFTERIGDSDLVIIIGHYPSDFNTGEFTTNLQEDKVIDFQRLALSIAGHQYDLAAKHLLPRLIHELSNLGSIVVERSVTWDPYPNDSTPKPDKLTQDYLWAQLGKYFQPGDFVIAETGTSSYGIPASNLMNVSDVRMFNQTVFGSIGYATGAALGAFIAGKEDGSIKRGILVTGEGSLQLTVQTFSDLLRHGLNTTVFLLNNDGYTVERLIHGMEASYNQVPMWNYSKMCETFGPSFPARYYRVQTGDELLELLADAQFVKADCTQVVELILHKHDAPMSVKLASKAVEEFNKSKK
ncbi:uncharacterized protein N7458_003836 [Penicillium daleae]|uniref:Pyruvate decarboxylase n=1 Tax=Penicillium daleae TaxID=63821 RepID=A0AAD6G591_9EURO|nr:uncharacterized protein N7458_003836 [Penicillium daleae]KAJ5455572.1 hypothetical protein N7458_003836 [Penicillium daleae]